MQSDSRDKDILEFLSNTLLKHATKFCSVNRVIIEQIAKLHWPSGVSTHTHLFPWLIISLL